MVELTKLLIRLLHKTGKSYLTQNDYIRGNQAYRIAAWYAKATLPENNSLRIKTIN